MGISRAELCVDGEYGRLDEALLDRFGDDLIALLGLLATKKYGPARKFAAQVIADYTASETFDTLNELPSDKLFWPDWEQQFADTGGAIVIPHDARFTDRHFQGAFCRVLQA